MKYRMFMFKADQNPELAAEYCRNHAAVLAEYGCGGISSSRQEWMDNPEAYAIVVYDEMGQMVSGIRLHFYHKDFPLPMESALMDVDARVSDVVRAELPEITGEICGLWTARSIRSKGFGLIMCRMATALAARFGASSLFGLVSPHTYDMFLTFGYVNVCAVGRNGDFLYPTADYISTVMVVPDLASMAHATEAHRDRMMSIRKHPVQVTRGEGVAADMLIEYHLDRFIFSAPAPVRRLAEVV